MAKVTVEVAVAFTDGTWSTVMTDVDFLPFSTDEKIEKAAEDKVLKDFSNSTRAVAFTKAIWIDPEEEEG